MARAVVLAWILLTIVVLHTGARTVNNLYYVPSDAKPGHVVTVVKTFDGQRQPSVNRQIGAGRYFSVLSGGELITTSDISDLVGSTLTVTLKHDESGTTVEETVNIQVVDTNQRVDYDNQPYIGRIAENRPVGSHVEGLEALSDYMRKLPYGCAVQAEHGKNEFFTVTITSGQFEVSSKQVFDRERQDSYYFILRTSCANYPDTLAMIRVMILDENDNKPRFNNDHYYVTVYSSELRYGEPIIQVKATDADQGDRVTYHLQDADGLAIEVIEETGAVIYVSNYQSLATGTFIVYLFAQDSVGHQSVSVPVQIVVVDDSQYQDYTAHHRRKRDVFSRRTFVVRQTDSGELFTVASYPLNPDERFTFVDPAPSELSLDFVSGMINLTGTWSSNPLSFEVNITYASNATGFDTLPVTVNIVTWGEYEPLFTNMPQPLWAVVPVWIRPGTVVMRLQARADATYGAKVYYRIETGDLGRFAVDPFTGDISIVGRLPFESNVLANYQLAISAQNLGAANKTSTPTQTIYIRVDILSPQFWYPDYIVGTTDSTPVGGVVTQLQAKSFYDLDLTYTWVPYANANPTDAFALAASTGVVTLSKALSYTSSDRVYWYNLTTSEPSPSPLRTTTLLAINLLSVNHAPMFAPTVYVQQNWPDTQQNNILYIEAIDNDPGEEGNLTFTTTDPLFIVNVNQYDRKSGYISATGSLDYYATMDHMYRFNVTATDNGTPPLSGTVEVQIYLLRPTDATGNRAPVFYPTQQYIFVKQGVGNGRIVHVISAYDEDGDTIQFEFVRTGVCASGTSTTCGPFLLDQATGHITVPGTVSTSDNMNITLQASSANTTPVFGYLYVSFVGVNHPPSFPQCQSYRPAIPESTPIGSFVTTVSAIDADSGNNGHLDFSLYWSAQETPRFLLNYTDGSKSASLYTLTNFDRENPIIGNPDTGAEVMQFGSDVYIKVTVIAVDRGRPQLQSTCFFFVKITDANDNSPVFDNNPYKATILATLPRNSQVVRVYATDADVGSAATIRYTLTPTVPPFTIDSNTGWISVGNVLLVTQTYHLNVTATDGGSPSRSSVVQVDITTITDPSGIPPVWQTVNGVPIDQYQLNVSETVPQNTPLLPCFSAFPQSSSMVYSVWSGAFGAFGYQQVTNATGTQCLQLIVQGPLDHSKRPRYVLGLRVASSGGTNVPYSDVRLQVNIINENNRVPEFEGISDIGSYQGAVSDVTKPGDFVLVVTAIDPDAPTPYGSVTYDFVRTTGTDWQSFRINATSGEITANTTYTRDRQTEYAFLVVAKDTPISGVQRNATAWVSVEVTGPSNAPAYFAQPSYTVTLEEDLPIGHEIANITATNPDPDFNYPQYALIGGNQLRKFGIANIESGIISVTGQLLLSAGTTYTLTYRVFDGAFENITSVTITLLWRNKVPPVFTQPNYTAAAVAETGLTLPHYLVTVSSSDPEGSGVCNYQLSGFEYSPTRFILYPNLTVYLLEQLSADYPNGHLNWQFSVSSYDNCSNGQPTAGSRQGFATITVPVTDTNTNRPNFFSCCVNITIPDSRTAGSVSTTPVSAFDPDPTSRIMYSLSGNSNFQIDTSTGYVTSQIPLDYTVQNYYEATVSATDGTYSDSALLMIHVANAVNHPPTFAATTFTGTVLEQQYIGTSVLGLTANDPDVGNLARLTYSIVNSPDFYVDSMYASRVGVIKTNRVFDYEQGDNRPFPLVVSVTDGSASATATVTVNIANINDPPFITSLFKSTGAARGKRSLFNTPVVMTTVSIREDLPISSSVATVTATDPENNTVVFSIDYAEDSDPMKWFVINPVSGLITTRTVLHWEQMSEVNVRILAANIVTPNLAPATSTAMLTVSIEDVNNHAPDFAEQYMAFVGTGTAQGSPVLSFTITDADSPANGPPFTVTCDTGNSLCSDFTIQGNGPTYSLIANRAGGYPRSAYPTGVLQLPISMTDTAALGSPLKAVRNIPIIIKANDDYNQQAGSKTINVANYDGNLLNAVIGTAYCPDNDDLWDIDNKQFTKIDGDASLAVDQTTGLVRLVYGPIAGTYTMNVNCRDSVRNVDAVCTITVNVFYPTEEHLANAGTIRFQGINASHVVETRYSALTESLASAIGVSQQNIAILTIRDAPAQYGQTFTDVFFTATGSNGLFRPAKLNGLVWTNRAAIGNSLGNNVIVYASPIDACSNVACYGGGCRNSLVFGNLQSGLLVDSNQTSIVGIDVQYAASCQCDVNVFPFRCDDGVCLNGGTCTNLDNNGFACVNCPTGFTGPRCQQVKLSFDGNSWAWVEPLAQCTNTKTSFEFMTRQADGLLLYTGPMYNTTATDNLAFLSVELTQGYPRVRVNLGEGEGTALTVNGYNSGGLLRMGPLNDGMWHTIEIIKQGQEIRLVVDHCRSSSQDVVQDINTHSSDRASCEAIGTPPGVLGVLNVTTPVELGGRSRPNVNYPANIITTGFNGCIKNFRHSGKLYDLNMGLRGQSQNTADSCSSELGCNGGANTCSINSTCVGNMVNSQATCQCNPAYGGPGCTAVNSKDYSVGGFVQWKFNGTFNSTLTKWESTLQLMFRTRASDAQIFYASSFSTFELFILQVVGTHLVFSFDLGAGERQISLSNVAINDGEWHFVNISRYGNNVVLQVDGGEGVYYGESYPVDEFELISLTDQGHYGAANVVRKRFTNEPVVKMELLGCMNDVRYDQTWFPLASDDPISPSVAVAAAANVSEGCVSNACAGVTCPGVQTCRDLWRAWECVCPLGYSKPANDTSLCIRDTNCNSNPCVHGTCVVQDNTWKCFCDVGWQGENCDLVAGQSTGSTLSAGAIVGIVIGIIAFLILLILLILLLLACRRKEPMLIDDDDDYRDTVMNYEEEGGGEEDMQAYDPTCLQKPVFPGDAMYPPVVRDTAQKTEAAPQSRYYPTPSSGERPRLADVLGGRLKDADDDPTVPPFDSVREYEQEGEGSQAGSLSSLGSSSSGGDQDFGYLNDLGPPFRKLADLYGGNYDDDGDELSSV